MARGCDKDWYYSNIVVGDDHKPSESHIPFSQRRIQLHWLIHPPNSMHMDRQRSQPCNRHHRRLGNQHARLHKRHWGLHQGPRLLLPTPDHALQSLLHTGPQMERQPLHQNQGNDNLLDRHRPLLPHHQNYRKQKQSRRRRHSSPRQTQQPALLKTLRLSCLLFLLDSESARQAQREGFMCECIFAWAGLLFSRRGGFLPYAY